MSDVDPLSLLQPAATQVRDPVTGRSIWLAGMLQNARMEDDKLRFDLVFSVDHSRADRRSIEEAVAANLRGRGWEGEILVNARLEVKADEVGTRPKRAPEAPKPPPQKKQDPVPGMSGPGMRPHGGPIKKMRLPGVTHLICVASGKGGVGKSTVATNVAVALRAQGHRVGLMDADVYGPSLPTMMNVDDKPLATADRKIVPVLAHGVRCMSIGLLVPKEQAIIWRGPMVMGAVRQFLQETAWGELDYLVVDLPPGTGDAQLTLIQAVEISGAIIVTTPQEVALADAVRGIEMFRKLEVPILGVVENMAYYPLPDGTRDYVFGRDGGKRTADKYQTELLAEIPLQTALRQSGDDGTPAALGSDAMAGLFRSIAIAVVDKLPLAVA